MTFGIEFIAVSANAHFEEQKRKHHMRPISLKLKGMGT
jgi:hypothetical protein